MFPPSDLRRVVDGLVSSLVRQSSRLWCEQTLFLVIALLLLWQGRATAEEQPVAPTPPSVRGAILAAADVTSSRLDQLKRDDFNGVAIMLSGATPAETTAERDAAQRVKAAGLVLHYWIEVARCPQLADDHPEWMASLQTHEEWRRFFPKAATPASNEVVKTYPWVPILSREPFAAQLDRVKGLITGKPIPDSVFLNDLQGAPSACGCGNPLCRWTSDYGKRRTTTPLADDAATLFVNAVKKVAPTSTIVPVWTTECEEHDGAADGQCAGVGCFTGICWKAYTKQLAPLEQVSDQLGVLVPYRAFHRDAPRYGEEAGWVNHAVESFARMPPRNGGRPIEAARLVTVLQGWDVSPQQISAQIQRSGESGAAGYLVAFTKLDQSWSPKIVSWR